MSDQKGTNDSICQREKESPICFRTWNTRSAKIQMVIVVIAQFLLHLAAQFKRCCVGKQKKGFESVILKEHAQNRPLHWLRKEGWEADGFCST